MKKHVKNILSLIILIVGIVVGLWLSLYVMLYGGIMQAYNGFTSGDVSSGVWGVIRAVFFEVGSLPIWIGLLVSCFVSD